MNNTETQIKWGLQSPCYLISNEPVTLKGSATVEGNIPNEETKANVASWIINNASKVASKYNSRDELNANLVNVAEVIKLSVNRVLSAYNIEIKSISIEYVADTVGVIDSNPTGEDGQVKCPMCGSTEITPSKTTGKLVCNYCRTTFEPVKAEGFKTDLSNLKGTVMGSGAQNIDNSASTIVTLKCESCGAEVVIDTNETTNARCHWCRNRLLIEKAVPNGAVPDVVLPFAIQKNDAKTEIEKFVKKRKFFAHPTFTKEFTTENIMAVYFPYMLVDANIHSTFQGLGEVQTRMYTRGSGDNAKTYYDANCFNVKRDYDLTVEGLSIESSKDRLNNASSEKTNNVINAIMPFDTENAVKWNANYLKGCTSEKRDANIEDLQSLVKTQVEDVSRFACNETLKEYDRGVKWESQNTNIKGSQWKAAYLPVWLYSYQQVKGNKKLLHYVAVNARTKETMGSVPINMTKLWIFSIIFEIVGFFIMLAIEDEWRFIFLLCGPVFFFIFYARYRNSAARHTYELETKHTMSNLLKSDIFLEERKGLTESKIAGCNNTQVNGTTNSTKFIDKINGKEISKSIVDSYTSGNPVANYINKNIQNKDKK